MSNPDDQAFPRSYAYQNPESGVSELRSVPGLTKREEFAKAAMQGLVTNEKVMEGMAIGAKADLPRLAQGIAEMALAVADALIARLNKGAMP